MPRWLKWWFALFLVVNTAAWLLKLPNPIVLIYEALAQPAAAARTVDSLNRGVGVMLACGMLAGWLALAVIMAVTMKDRHQRKKRTR